MHVRYPTNQCPFQWLQKYSHLRALEQQYIISLTVNLINIEGKSSIFHVCLSQTYFVGGGIKELPQNKYNTAD